MWNYSGGTVEFVSSLFHSRWTFWILSPPTPPTQLFWIRPCTFQYTLYINGLLSCSFSNFIFIKGPPNFCYSPLQHFAQIQPTYVPVASQTSQLTQPQTEDLTRVINDHLKIQLLIRSYQVEFFSFDLEPVAVARGLGLGLGGLQLPFPSWKIVIL